MKRFGELKGENAIVQFVSKRQWMIASVLLTSVLFAACGGGAGGPGANSNETAATVNGKVIKMEEVERGIKQQAQGQESKLSPLELASARLQVLQSLIEQEVMFQKAQKENTVPTDEEVTAEINKQKQESRMSAEEFDKQMTDAGFTEASLKENTKRALAIRKLVEKITSRIDAPKDSEIDAFYNGNKDAFVKRKGVKLAAIVIDPAKTGEGDVTTDEVSSVAKANEIIGKIKAGQDFATLASEFSEDQSRFQRGELGYLSEDDLRQAFPEGAAAALMNPQLEVGQVVNVRSQGKLFILKLQERSDKDEALTLESPGVRQQVIESLGSSRKQLLAASYQAIAMNEAKIENYLAKKVVDNPNELSGARPAGASTPAAPASPATASAASPAAPASPAKTDAKPAAPASPAKK
ncbi:MAG: SurA N-terminal domain-containing protein [Blastocatellia bacterium]|nr:SurA N-terminal domain-containing protein [Blastocatellia bacterium]